VSAVEAVRARALEGVAHGFLGRRGGVSTGIHAGLNVGTGSQDDPRVIAENRRLATEAVLPGAKLVTVFQVHSPDAVTAIAPFDERQRPHADALVTDRPGLALGILTADCAPVLFADAQAGVVGAAHAGWKGAIGGVTDSTLAAMEALGARRERIAAAIGPCIARASYEVDDAFLRRFAEADPANERFFADGRAGTTSSISRPMSRTVSPQRASARSRCSGRTPMRSPTASSASAAPRTQAKAIMAARSR